MNLINVGRQCSCGTSVRMESTDTKKICPACGATIEFPPNVIKYLETTEKEVLVHAD